MKADEIAARRTKVSAAILSHMTQREASDELDIPLATINRDMKAVRVEWQAIRVAAADSATAEDLQRLAAAEKAIWPAVEKGDVTAIDRLLRIMERRAKLLGLDAPKRIDITERLRAIASENGLDPDEAVREAARIIKSLP